jgi:hypothetical protein
MSPADFREYPVQMPNESHRSFELRLEAYRSVHRVIREPERSDLISQEKALCEDRLRECGNLLQEFLFAIHAKGVTLEKVPFGPFRDQADDQYVLRTTGDFTKSKYLRGYVMSAVARDNLMRRPR